MHRNWGNLNHFSVFVIVVLSFIGAMFNTKRYCKTNPDIHKKTKAKTLMIIIGHLLFDFVSIGSISLIVYLGLIGYGINDLLAVAISGFLAKEGNTALYQLKIVIADKIGSEALMHELKKDKEVEQ